MVEQWRHVVGFESTYEVSDNGRVRSLSRTVAANFGPRPICGRVLKLKISAAGYPSVQLCDGKRIRDVQVHRLVAEAFLEKTGFLVRHLDGNPKNNRLANLAWGSHSDNEADKRRHGRQVEGVNHHRAKLNRELVILIRESVIPDLQLSRELKIGRYAIYSVRKGLTWRHVT